MCWQLWGWSKVKGPWLPRVARMERTAVISLLSLPLCSQRGVLTSSFAVQHVSQQNTSAASLPMAPSWPELCSSWGPSKTLPFELVVTPQISITSPYSVLLASVGKGGNRTREAGRTHRESRLELGWGSILCCRSWGASCWAQKQRLLRVSGCTLTLLQTHLPKDKVLWGLPLSHLSLCPKVHPSESPWSVSGAQTCFGTALVNTSLQ